MSSEAKMKQEAPPAVQPTLRPVEKRTRITSYNVCYTKLLRAATGVEALAQM